MTEKRKSRKALGAAPPLVADSAADRRRIRLIAIAILPALLLVYHLNGEFLVGNDAKPNVYLAVSVLNEGNPSFTPDEMPFMFLWKLQVKDRTATCLVPGWDRSLGGVPFARLREAGLLTLKGNRYYVVPSVREGEYVCAYGPGAGLCFLPVAAVLHVMLGDLAAHPAALWYGAKFTAALLLAASAVAVFLTACLLTAVRRAALIALVYGLGTCVWSTSSQSLWQHGANEFFLALGALLLVRASLQRRRWQAVACGAAFATAVVCRPTSAAFLAAVGVYLLVVDVKALARYALGCLPLLLAVAGYNAYYLGSPLAFGQELSSLADSARVAGAGGVWQTPLWEGLAGVLVSPSRGLFVYSPVFLFALPGFYYAWRSGELRALRPLTVAILAVLIASAKYYNWWGGWSYGYRLLVDLSPALSLLLVPVLDRIWRRRIPMAAFGAVLGWCVFVQVVGVFAYDLTGWNNRTAYEVRPAGGQAPVIVDTPAEADRLRSRVGGQVRPVELDVDRPQYRHRLWSISDSQILCCLAHFGEFGRHRHEMARDWLADPAR